ATYRVGFQVFRSDRYVMLGPSGCGKSTLLKAVGGYIEPVEGEMWLNGKPIRKPGPDRVMVFQEFDQLLPWKTVRENVTFALAASGKLPRRESEERAMHYIEKVNLGKFADSYPHTLSGGMKQRVAIARGMAMEPEILLMDEPFAALDALTRRKMQDELLQLWDDTHFTVLFVTHSIPEAVLVEKPLTPWERVYGNSGVRKGALLVLLAVIWELYARKVGNPLVFPTFTATVEAFVSAIISGVIPQRTWASINVLLRGYAVGLVL